MNAEEGAGNGLLCLKPLKRAYDNNPVAFVLIEMLVECGSPVDFAFRYANHAACRLTGIPFESLIGQRFYRLFGNADRKLLSACFKTAFEGESQRLYDCVPFTGKHLRIDCFQYAMGMCGCLLQDMTDQLPLPGILSGAQNWPKKKALLLSAPPQFHSGLCMNASYDKKLWESRMLSVGQDADEWNWKGHAFQTELSSSINQLKNNPWDMAKWLMASIFEQRSLEMHTHLENIQHYTDMILREAMRRCTYLKLTEEQICLIARLSALHDIGKVGIPDAILLQPRKLTKDEYEAMKRHTVIGAEIVRWLSHVTNDVIGAEYAYHICLLHHERYDGKGYPNGLRGDEIPFYVQAVGIADVYDSLVSERVYKPKYAHERAMQMILGGECGAFSEQLLGCFIPAITRNKDTCELR